MSARADRQGFACPGCGCGALGIARRLVLPGDRRSDEIALEILACACGVRALAVAEQLQKPGAAALKAKEPQRMAFRLAGAAVDLLAFLMEACPDPAEEYCDCPAHGALNRRDLRDQWNLLHSFAPVTGFALRPAREPAHPAAGYAYAPLAWARNGHGFAARVEGREWRLEPPPAAAAPYALSIGGALDFEFDAAPPFWHLPD